MTKTLTIIVKRDGRTALYNRKKITEAIFRAAEAVGGADRETAATLSLQVEDYVLSEMQGETPSVEFVQDAIEKVLIENGHAKTAKEFILYRAERTKMREMNNSLMKTYENITFQAAEDNDIKRENANIDGDTAMGTMLKYGSEGAKKFYEMFILDPKYVTAHDEGFIHIHDLDFLTLTTTCCQIDLDKLFENGFDTGHGFIRQPQSIQTYAALACIAIQSNQNDQHGGQSVPAFDFNLAKGVAKSYAKIFKKNLEKALDFEEIEDNAQLAVSIIEKIESEHSMMPTLSNQEEYVKVLESELNERLSDAKLAGKIARFTKKHSLREIERDTFQAMEALVHNLNTMHSRAGAQVPFSSLNYGTDTSPEGRLVTKSILMSTDAGMGDGETAIFPIHIFKVKEGVNYNPQDPNYDLFKLACKVSAKRLFPNFSFLDAPYNAVYYKEGCPETEVSYMGCRTRVIGNVHDPSREIVTGRGNLSFTSINLPKLAIEANKDIDKFFEELEETVELVFDQLMDRYKIIAQKTMRNFPFLMGQGIWMDSEKLGPDDPIGEVLKHGSLSIGFIGLAEALTSLVGKHHGESPESQTLGLEIIGFVRSMCDQKARETGFNYTVIATPAEGLSGRFVRMDSKKYGIIPGVTDKEYYTNSFHIPVGFDISAFDKIKLEAPYHALTNAGHITYVEVDGDPLKNLDAFESIVRCMKESGVGYGSINHPVDRDPICGYNGIIDNECPKCGREEGSNGMGFERIRRITGYLVGTLDRFNDAKRAEERDRVKHNTKI